MNQIRYASKSVALIALAALLLLFAPANYAQVCPFDDGNSSLQVEGLILTRYALGLTGAPLVASTGINAVDAQSVEAMINCPSCGLNITGNATLTVADATIISRKLAGFSGPALTDGISLGSGTRKTPAAVQSFLLAGCGSTGGTVTSITAGTGLTGGIITGSGTIGADTNFLQRRVSATCAAGSFITAVAVDGTVTCGIPPAGVTAVAATAPLASSGGTNPNISLTGSVAVANGGTGQSTLSANGVVIGQGTSAVATAVGTAGQVLTGTAGLPTWTGAPTLTGPLTVNGNIKLGSTGQFFAPSGEENLRFVRGIVFGYGAPFISSGLGFTVARTAGESVGDYIVTFSTPFSNTPTATVSTFSGIAAVATLSLLSATAMRVQINFGPSLVDQNWSFIAVGPR